MRRLRLSIRVAEVKEGDRRALRLRLRLRPCYLCLQIVDDDGAVCASNC